MPPKEEREGNVCKLLEMPAKRSSTIDAEPVCSSDPKAALEELFQLLEEYAPAWYPEEIHDRALAALQRCR